MCQDVVEGGNFATNESHIRHLRRDDVPVQVEPVLLDVELFLDYLVEDVVVLGKARPVDHDVGFQLLAISEDDPGLREFVNSPCDRLNLPGCASMSRNS